MKNNILTVMKKELTRFFTDKRMVLTTIFMPGIMIYCLYTFMGQGLRSQFEQAEDFKATVYTENLPDSVKMIVEQEELMNLKEVSDKETDGIKEKIREGEAGYDLLAVFPQEFDREIAAYDAQSGEAAPNVELYYNSTETDSSTAYQVMQEILDMIESSMANKFDVNAGEETYDMATEEDTSAMVFSMMIPMLLIMFLFSGCMAVAPESIAGEKERGTIATLLVTPMKRSHLALGKILSLSIIAVLSGCSSFLGTMLSLPALMGGAEEEINANVYGMRDYVMVFLIIISTVMVIVSLISIVSAFAKSVKEAGGWATPIMIISMLIGITSMVESLCMTEPVFFLIPLYNSVQSLNAVFSLRMDVTNIVVTVVSNFCYAGVGVFALTKMFNSEKIMFSR